MITTTMSNAKPGNDRMVRWVLMLSTYVLLALRLCMWMVAPVFFGLAVVLVLLNSGLLTPKTLLTPVNMVNEANGFNLNMSMPAFTTIILVVQSFGCFMVSLLCTVLIRKNRLRLSMLNRKNSRRA